MTPHESNQQLLEEPFGNVHSKRKRPTWRSPDHDAEMVHSTFKYNPRGKPTHPIDVIERRCANEDMRFTSRIKQPAKNDSKRPPLANLLNIDIGYLSEDIDSL